MTTNNSSCSWDDLPDDLLTPIRNRLELPDLIRFRCVCTAWRDLSAAATRTGSCFPLLILTRAKIKTNCVIDPVEVLEVYSLLDKSRYKLEIPELDHRRICGTSYGWMVTVHANSEIQLLHPLTRNTVELPPMTAFPDFSALKDVYYITSCSPPRQVHSESIRDYYISKMITNYPPDGDDHNVVCMAITCGSEFHPMSNRLYLCRCGKSNSWSNVTSCYRSYSDLAYYRGIFFALLRTGDLHVVEGIDSCSPYVSLFVPLIRKPQRDILRESNYLVVSSSDLLQVIIWRSGSDYSFSVFKLDFDARSWIEVRDLEDRALFVGSNHSYSVVAAEFPGCKENCIYLSDLSVHSWSPISRRRDRCIYNMKDGSIETFYSIDSKSPYISSIFWFSLNSTS